MTIAVVNDTQPSVNQEVLNFGGPATFPDAGSAEAIKWLSDGYLEAEYTFYAIQTTYDTDLGLQAAPKTASRAVVAGAANNPPGPTYGNVKDENVIVRVRRPITFKVVNWTAQRLYDKPLLPHWNTGATNEKLLKRIISVRNPLQSLNHKTWEVSGQYVYAFKKEPFITVNQIEYFVLPAGKTTAENSKIPVALHAYTQGDFSFVPLDAAWIPVNAPLAGTNLPVGYNSRVGLPDSVPRQEGAPRVGPA